MIKIYIYYNITDQPWGGGNSFLKAFRKYVRENKSEEFEIVDDIDGDYDIFFVNGGHKDQGKYIDVNEILSKSGRTGLFKKFKKQKKIIYRLDGARYKYNGTRSEMDELQYKALQIADYTIFQSDECVLSFQALGYNGKNHSIVYNGVDQTMFNLENKKFWDGKSKLKIFSANWSANEHKGYDVISKFSLNSSIDSSFVGNWNENTSKNNVTILPPMRQEELADHYKAADVFLHAAENDPCPNVVLEALSCGLPIIYHNSGGTKEISAKYGVPLPDKINDESIEETVRKIAQNYDTYVKNIKKDIAKFSMQTVAEQYLDIFKKVYEQK